MTTQPVVKPVQAERLTRLTKVAYGVGDMGGAAVVTITGFFLTAFLLDVAGLRPGAVGVIFLLAQIWDAVTDPVVGVWSDRTRTRWGRKRPWILFGALPFGLAYVLNWVVPDLQGAALFAYYLGVALLFRTAFTVVGIPYGALTPELTRDYDARTSLNTYRFSFNLVGSLLAVTLHPLLVGLGGDVFTGNLISAGVWGLFIVLSLLFTFRYTYELTPIEQNPDDLQDETTPLEASYGYGSAALVRSPGGVVREFREAFRSRSFLFATGIYFFSWLTLLLVQNNLLLFIRYYALVESQFTGVILAFQVTAILFLGVWERLSHRIGKRGVYVAGVSMWALGLAALYLVPRGEVALYYLASSFIGMGGAVAYLIPWSMLPDVVDEDELRTGRRREGVFYGMFVFSQKLGLSVGLAASGFALEAAGYLTPGVAGEIVTQPDAVLTTLRLLVSVVPAVLLLLSLPLAYFYPLTRERYADVRARLEARS